MSRVPNALTPALSSIQQVSTPHRTNSPFPLPSPPGETPPQLTFFDDNGKTKTRRNSEHNIPQFEVGVGVPTDPN